MYPVVRARNRKKELVQKEYMLSTGEVLEYLTFPKLTEIKEIEHVFTTRVGGVSEGEYATWNFSFTRGDDVNRVLENYRRVADIFQSSMEDTTSDNTKQVSFVTTDQTHTTNIRVVSKKDAGKGVTIDRDYTDIDGLLTNEKGLILSCFFADCVPLYFVDTSKKVIGLAHSGWRGTVNGMGACMVQRMQEIFACNPSDIQTCIGPSICQDCYEISEEVAMQFQTGFWEKDSIRDFCKETYESGMYPKCEILEPGKTVGKWQLDLWLANYVILRSAGIPAENISITDMCTCCNAPYLFSHRATGGKRGNLAAFLMLK